MSDKLPNIKKQFEATQQQETRLSKVKEELQSRCTHTKRGEPDIVPTNNREAGKLTYICRNCRKQLNLSQINEAELSNALSVIDNACDIIKITLNPEREEELSLLKKIAKTQYRVRNDIQKLYGASLKRNRSGDKRRRNRDEDSVWSKPRTDR